MRVLVASGFFESELPSYREYSYCQQLAKLGHDVTLMCGDQSQIWTGSRVKLAPTDPTARDAHFISETGVKLVRCKVRFRYSDFVLYWPTINEIRQADIVHVIEFRTGTPVLIALIAKLLRKPVVYDHEQRGDRLATWYSRADSIWRRLLIRIGAQWVDTVRHTTLANRAHFLSCTKRNVEMKFAPLGVDPQRFYFDSPAREALRAKYGIDQKSTVVIMSGKLHGYKRVPDVVLACRMAGVQLILVGSISQKVQKEIDELPQGAEIQLSQVSAEELRGFYSMADIAIFTTFTLSYWEAHATGVKMIVPNTTFSRLVFEDDGDVKRFGMDEMFLIPDEQYAADVKLDSLLAESLLQTKATLMYPLNRKSRMRFSAAAQVASLAGLYRRLTNQYGNYPRT